MRAFEEINDAVESVMSVNDATALLRLADELEELATPEAMAVAHTARGWACFCTSDYPAALEHYSSAVALHRELGSRKGVARVTNGIGIVYYNSGDYPAAFEHYKIALALYNDGGNRGGVATVTANIGNVYNKTGNYPAALEHFNNALALYQELENRNGVAAVTGNIGIVYVSTGDYHAALEYYSSALALCQELGDRRGEAIGVHNIGTVYFSTGNYHAALESYNSDLVLFHELGYRSGVAQVTGQILHALLCSDNMERAVQTLAALDELHIDDPGVAVGRETARAEIYAFNGDMQAAQTTLADALDLTKTHGLRASQADVCKGLRDLALRQNDLPAYVEHNNEFTRITEEIRGKEASIKLAMQAKEREIAEREKEHAKHLAVLHSTLPKHVADRVARGEVVNDSFENAAVLFLDIVGFTTMSSQMEASAVVELLDRVFAICDSVMNTHGMMKIKTIGDSYMAVSFDNIESAALAALDLVASITEVDIRIGIHCGPVVAGVLGRERMQYDVWGDTVNVASRMESSSEAGRVHVSQAFASQMKEEKYRIQNTEFNDAIRESRMKFVERGETDIKGKGLMTTYWLEAIDE